MSGAVLSRSARIARLNDRARQAMGLTCVAVATEGFRALPVADQSRVRELVETFDAFTPENDPVWRARLWRNLSGLRWALDDHATGQAG